MVSPLAPILPTAPVCACNPVFFFFISRKRKSRFGWWQFNNVRSDMLKVRARAVAHDEENCILYADMEQEAKETIELQ